MQKQQTTASQQPVITVALPVPMRQEFDYLVPPHMPVPVIGARVCVPFGRRELIGLVTDHPSYSSMAVDKLKSISEILDQMPLFNDSLWKLLKWASTYYHHPFGETLSTALPTPS